MKERLAKAGYSGRGIFKKKTLRELYRITGGTPRLINNICDGTLLLGYARQEPVLGPEAVREVANDLGLLESDGADQNKNERSQEKPARRRRRFLRFRR